MTADYAALEARVTALEQEVRHALPAKVDAVSWALGILHRDVRDFRQEMGAFREDTRAALDEQAAVGRELGVQLASHTQQLAALRETQAEHGQALGDIQSTLAEVLRRLPGEPGD